jgi:hypothetical protein
METLLSENLWILILLSSWVLPWKGYALWKAARLSHKGWFIAILILNTFAILEIIYIFFVARRGENGAGTEIGERQ